MPLARVEITAMCIDDKPADATVNAVYHSIGDGIFDPSTDWDNHCQEVLDCFTGNAAGYSDVDAYSGRLVTAKAYDMADPTPRPVKSQKTFTPANPNHRSVLGPGQVACCMSYYGARNLPSERGRLFIGPFDGSQLVARPPDTMLASLLNLGHALFDVGGENVAWVVRSEKKGTTEPITTIWVDDAWDTQRRREIKATKRSTLKP